MLNRVLGKIGGKVAALALATAVMVGFAQQARAVSYIAGTRSDDSIHLLDAGLNDTGSFPVGAGADSLNGLATDGTLIWSGHPFTGEIIAYNFAGVEQFRFAGPLGLTGMELVGNELAATDLSGGSTVNFYNPTTGAFIRSIPAQSSFVEGLAYDGSALWQLDTGVITATNPANGAVIASIPNAADLAGAPFVGTGLTANAPGQLALAATDGRWWIVSSVDGSIINTGNNGLNMFALKAVPQVAVVPEPISAGLSLMGLGVLGIATRRRTA